MAVIFPNNSVNVNEITNAIPPYQDMFIFVELTAEKRGRTIIATGAGGSVSTTDSGVINFIGNNQSKNKDNPNRYNFTTNYYDGSVINENQYEGFGISSINVKVNSSYIPQVNIQFVDIRGQAFFNQKDSPYRMLFDFPPPIFKLTVKGYYGMALAYDLHLVKYTSEFQAETGNFVINADFVAMTFAPLTDILFRYVVNASIINNIADMRPTSGVPPKNTYDLILKLRRLYAGISDKVNTQSNTNDYSLVNAEI